MKLAEIIDDEKENTCNGHGISENSLAIKKVVLTESTNGDLNDSGSSEPAGVGDLLIEDPNTSRHEDNEENIYQNGNKGDDSTSISSNSSNFPVEDLHDELSDDDLTLRLSEDEDMPVPVANESNNMYFTSSPCPKADDDINKKEEKESSSQEETANSEISQDTDKCNKKTLDKLSESEKSNTSETSEKTNNFDAKSTSDEKNNIEEKDSSNDKINSEEKYSFNKHINSCDKNSSVESSSSDLKNSSNEKICSDDNLDNLISDLNEQSKSAIKSENKKVTISDLRKEIEDFIKNHDNEKSDNSDTEAESSLNNSSNDKSEEETEIKNSEKKSDEMEIENKINSEIMDDKSVKKSGKLTIKKKELNKNSDSLKTESSMSDSEKVSEQVEDDKSESNLNNKNFDKNKENTNIVYEESINNKNDESINNKTDHSTNDKIENSTINKTDGSTNITVDSTDNITEDSIGNKKVNSNIINEDNTNNKTENSINNAEEGAKNRQEQTSEKTEEMITEDISEQTNEESKTKSSVEESKQNETMGTSQTNTPEIIELSEPKTIESGKLDCQKIIDSSENIDVESNDNIKKPEVETEKSESEIICIESNIEENKDKDNISEEDKNENNDSNILEPMEIDSKEGKLSTEAIISENKETPTIICDDVEMKEEFETVKDTSKKENDNKALTNNEEDSIIEEIDLEDEPDFKEITDKVSEIIKDAESTEIEDEDVTEIKDDDVKVIKDEDIKKLKDEIKIQDGTKKEEIKENEDEEKTEEKTSLKRTLENKEDIQESKKPKINGLLPSTSKIHKEYVRMDVFRDFMSKKGVATLTRAELEQFCLQKMCEAITQTSKVSELNRKISQQESQMEALRTKFTSVQKQIRDLEVVHSRVLQEFRNKLKDGNVEVIPVKITRSVGLQVSLQPITGRVRTPISSPTVPLEMVGTPPTGIKRKIRASGPVKSTTSTSTTTNISPNPSPNSMPPPSRPPIHRSPNQGKGIKTILPKVYPPAEPKDNNSLLENYLQSPTPGPSTSKSPATPVRKASPAAIPSTSATASTSTPKVIDLTDEDDNQKASTSSPAASTSTGNLRVVPQHQLQNSTTPVSQAQLPRLTYLLQGNNQQGQQVLLATSTAPTRPGQIKSTLMFKPVAPGQVPPGQRLNIVRPNSVPGITVLPSSSTSAIRPGQQIRFTAPVSNTRTQVRASAPVRHPAPLPGPPAVQPSQPTWKAMPPKPTLKISRVGDGIVLSWRMQNNKDMSLYEDIGSYQLYAYQETAGPPSTDMWRKVGDVKALALPMACTLTQFTDGNKYHFAVRAVDVKSRVGPFSQPEQIALP